MPVWMSDLGSDRIRKPVRHAREVTGKTVNLSFLDRNVACPPSGDRSTVAAQGDKKKKVQNDRIIAIEKDAHSWADIKTIGDLGRQFVRELEEFFVDYHKLSGEKYRVLGLKGRQQARKLVKSGMR